MAKEAVAQLFRAVQADPDLREELNTSGSIEELVTRAQSYGYEFTVEEWQAMTGFVVEELEGNLSEIPGL